MLLSIYQPILFLCFSKVQESVLLLLLSHFSRVQLCATPQMAAHQAPPSLKFSRQEHWSGFPFPSPMHESEVIQSCPTLSDPMDCSLPGSSIHGISRQEHWSGVPLTNISTAPLKYLCMYITALIFLTVLFFLLRFPDAAVSKKLPANAEDTEMWVQSLGQDDPLKKEMATHSSILAGKFHEQRSLVGYSPWGYKESDITKQLNTHTHTHTHKIYLK